MSKKKKLKTCVLAWMIYMKFNLCNTVCIIRWLSVNIITKNDIWWFLFN